MAKRKKKLAAVRDAPAAPAAPGGPFHNPFATLGKELKALATPPPAPPPPPPPPSLPRPAAEDEAEAFARAMRGVVPLADRGPARRPRDPEPPTPRALARVDEDLEVLAELADLVGGGGEFDLTFSDEYLEGHARGTSPELLARLAMGAFPIQEQLDLHGLREDDALAMVERFLSRSVGRGLRHVLLIHGRGLRSPGGVPVLKTSLAQLLGQKRLGKLVLAFCTAQARDGGTGAMYLLLRRHPGQGGQWSRRASSGSPGGSPAREAGNASRALGDAIHSRRPGGFEGRTPEGAGK